MAYSDYSSIQIFQFLNWKVNDKMIRSINKDHNYTFRVQHNQFSFLSQQEIEEKYLNLEISSRIENILLPSKQDKDAKKSNNKSKLLLNNSDTNQMMDIDWRSTLTTSVKFQG